MLSRCKVKMKHLFEDNTICRLCLKVDEKVYKLDNTDHKAFIESIIKLKQFHYVPHDDYYACYICYALLKKSFHLVQTIWNAQKIIGYVLKDTDMITKEILQNIDRNSERLNAITLTSVINNVNESTYESCRDGNESSDSDEVNLKRLAGRKHGKSKKKQKCEKEIENYISLILSSDEIEETDRGDLDEVEIETSNNNTKRGDPLTELSINYSSDGPKEENRGDLVKVEIETSNNNTKGGDPLTKLSINYSTDEPKEENRGDLVKVEIETSNNNTKRGDPLTKLSIINSSDGPKKENKLNIDKNNAKKKKRPLPIKAKGAVSPATVKKCKKNNDEDYQPDSTSHSEDSEYDSYDDCGKAVKIPSDRRVYPMKCDHCDYVLPEKRDHYRHYQYTHPEEEYPYKMNRIYACSVCGKLFAKGRIRRHEALHTTQHLKCSLCPKVFTNRLKWYKHFTTVHPKKTLTCDYCSKTFKTKTDIKRHIRTHTGCKPYKCHICGDAFAHSGNRIVHIRIKHQNYKYKPKNPKQTQNKRRRRSTDTEISDDEEITRRTKTKRRRQSKNHSQSADITPKRKRSKQVSKK